MKKADFKSLLAPIVAEYRERPYEFWQSRTLEDDIRLEVTSVDGKSCQVEIEARWDDTPDGDIRVFFSIDDGGLRAFVPVMESFVVAPDGKVVGE